MGSVAVSSNSVSSSILHPWGRTQDSRYPSQAATITSLASVPLTWLVPLESIFPAPSIFAVLLTLASSIGSQIALLFALYLFTSPLTSSGTLFARNFLLLCLATLGGDGFAIQDNWLQVIFVYAVGTAAIAWSDSEVSSSVRGISSQKGSQSASNTGYSLLNANGPAGNGLSSSPNLSNPSSPSLHPSTPPALGNRKSSSERIPQSTSASSASFLPQSPLLALVPFIPLIIHLLQPPASNIPPLTHACSLLPYSLRAAICPITAIPLDMSKNNVDIVISYYSEDLPHVKEHLDGMRKLPFVMERDERVVVYNKGPLSEEEIRQGMELLEHDEVVPLDNVGREGETYLKVSGLYLLLVLDRSAAQTSLITVAHLVTLQRYNLLITLSSSRFELLGRSSVLSSSPKDSRRSYFLPSTSSRVALGSGTSYATRGTRYGIRTSRTFDRCGLREGPQSQRRIPDLYRVIRYLHWESMSSRRSNCTSSFLFCCSFSLSLFCLSALSPPRLLLSSARLISYVKN